MTPYIRGIAIICFCLFFNSASLRTFFPPPSLSFLLTPLFSSTYIPRHPEGVIDSPAGHAVSNGRLPPHPLQQTSYFSLTFPNLLPPQEEDMSGAFDWEAFTLDGSTYLAVAITAALTAAPGTSSKSRLPPLGNHAVRSF